MKKISLLLSLVVAGLVVGGPALAQRRIIGGEGDAPADAGPAPDEAKPDDKKPDGKKDPKKDPKKDDKKPDDKKPDDKKPDGKATDPKKDPAKDPKKDILEDTAAEKKARDEADAKKKAAEKAAEDAAEKERLKKEDEQKKLAEEKRAAEDKRKLENKDARLATAKRVRQITRTAGDVGVSFALEPGEVKPGSLVEIRANVAKKLEKADPRYGNLEPLKGLDVVVAVTEPGSKTPKHYVMHALDAPGRYGFHFTPEKPGQYGIAVVGKGKSSFDATFVVHAGVWPPPDFDDEEKNNAAASTDAARAGRKLIGGN